MEQVGPGVGQFCNKRFQLRDIFVFGDDAAYALVQQGAYSAPLLERPLGFIPCLVYAAQGIQNLLRLYTLGIAFCHVSYGSQYMCPTPLLAILVVCRPAIAHQTPLPVLAQNLPDNLASPAGSDDDKGVPGLGIAEYPYPDFFPVV